MYTYYPDTGTKLWKDTATARAIGMPGTADVQRNHHQGRWEGRNVNTYTTLTEIRRTDQETAEIIIHVCSKKYCRNFKVPLPKLAVKNNKQLDLLKKCIPASYFTFYEKQALTHLQIELPHFMEQDKSAIVNNHPRKVKSVIMCQHSTPNSIWPSWRHRHRVCDFAHVSHVAYTYTLLG